MSLINNENMILSGLLNREEYFRKVIPYIKEEYFIDDSTKMLFKIINNYSNKYKEKPNKAVLQKTINEGLSHKGTEFVLEINEKLDIISNLELPNNHVFMVDETEKFCKNRAMYLAINKAIMIYDNNDDVNSKKVMDINAIPDLVKDALAVSFNTTNGHNYDDGAEERWAYYTEPQHKVKFDIDHLNSITNGGVIKKTLNLVVAGVNVGKTMLLVYLAAMYKRMGMNVLYITNEVNEYEISKRIDASLLNIETDMLVAYGKDKYLSRIEKLKESTHGRLFVKEFPTGTCSANSIRYLLQELDIKDDFKPDVIINDYITINRSDTTTYTGNTGTYFEAVAMEQRALAVEYDIIMWTAAQFNSEGMGSLDPELTNIGSSLGIAKTSDLVWAAMRTPALDEIGQISFKQLKTRYHKVRTQRWNLGIDIGTQRLYSVGNEEVDDSNTSSINKDNDKLKFKPENANKKILKI